MTVPFDEIQHMLLERRSPVHGEHSLPKRLPELEQFWCSRHIKLNHRNREVTLWLVSTEMRLQERFRDCEKHARGEFVRPCACPFPNHIGGVSFYTKPVQVRTVRHAVTFDQHPQDEWQF